MKKSDYKWIDIENENKTTENPMWWLRGLLIIIGFTLSILGIKYLIL